MPRDGSGNFARAVVPYEVGEIAEVDGALGVNTELDDVAAALTGSVARNGEATWTGDQDAGGFTVTGLRASALNGEAVRHEQLGALSGVYQPLEATLTGIAATTPASGQVIRATGPDTFTVDNTSAFGRGLWNVADLAAHVTALGGASAVRSALGVVADTLVVHLAGAETLTGTKSYQQAVGTDLVYDANTTTTNKVGRRFQSAGALWSLTPAPSATPDTAKDLYFDFTNSWWGFDTNLVLKDGASTSDLALKRSSANTGFWFNGDTIQFVGAGGNTMSITSGGALTVEGSLTPKGQVISNRSHSAGAPDYTFSGDLDNGPYYIGANDWGLSAGGSLVLELTTAGPKDANANLLMSTGKHQLPLTAAAWRAPTTNPAAWTTLELTTNKQMVAGWGFADGATTLSIQLSMPMPKSWNEGTFTARVRGYAASGSGDVVFAMQALAVSDGDTLDAAWGTAQTMTKTVTTGKQIITPESAAITAAGSPADADTVYFKLYRDPTVGGDTFSGTFIVTEVELFFSFNAANDV